MSKIKLIEGRKILDSRGKETVEVKVETDDGLIGIDSVPSGTSTGKYESKLVDVDIACANINKVIAPKLIGKDPVLQADIDELMNKLDGTENKDRLGANAILGVSLAVARVAALSQKIPLYKHINKLFCQSSGLSIQPAIPTPMMVMICGGLHAEKSDRNENLSIQEFSILGDVNDGIEVWHALEKYFVDNNISYTIGLEGAFTPDIENNDKALEILKSVITDAKVNSADDIKLALDIAGTNCRLTNDQVLNFFKKHNIFSVEDPFGEDDWEKFGQLKLELDELKIPYLLIGDDLFATHKTLLQKGINNLVANAIIIKPNQVGTLTEVFEVMKIAYNAKYACVVSHRSGETTDAFITDLAVGTAAKYLKAGAPVPSERMAKYHRLNEIQNELKE